MLFLLLSKLFSLADTNFLTLSINQNLECYADFSIAFHIHKWLHSCFMHCSFVNRCKMFSPHYRLPISMANAKKKRKKNYNKTICCWLNSFCCILFLIAAYVAHISKAFLTCNSDEAGVFSLDFFRISTQPRSWLSTSFWRLPIPPKSNSLCGNLTPFSGQNDWVWRAGSINCMQILLLFALLLLFAIEMPLSVDFTL